MMKCDEPPGMWQVGHRWSSVTQRGWVGLASHGSNTVALTSASTSTTFPLLHDTMPWSKHTMYFHVFSISVGRSKVYKYKSAIWAHDWSSTEDRQRFSTEDGWSLGTWWTLDKLLKFAQGSDGGHFLHTYRNTTFNVYIYYIYPI